MCDTYRLFGDVVYIMAPATTIYEQCCLYHVLLTTSRISLTRASSLNDTPDTERSWGGKDYHDTCMIVSVCVCVTVKWYVPTFVHWKYQCLSSQGCWPWLWPFLTYCLAIMGQKASVGSLPPTVIARDVMPNASYQIPSR